jgi:nitrogen fixation/metabolism regulation signal transduction histidine kinase
VNKLWTLLGLNPASLKSRQVRWLLGIGAAVMVLMGLALLFLLTISTNNRAQYEDTYGQLLIVNTVVASLLLLLILWLAIRLAVRLKQGKFGSQLLVKLALIFALVGFAPGVLIYVVSYQFVARSIESWFDVKVEAALDAGLNLGRVTIDVLSTDLGNNASVAARRLSDLSDVAASLELDRIREQVSGEDALLWSATGQLIGSAGTSRYQINPDRPTQQQLRAARLQRQVVSLEGLDEATAAASVPTAPTGTTASVSIPTAVKIKVLAIVQPSGLGISTEPRFLQITQLLSPTLVANALAVTEANREYQNRALARGGLKRMYIATLTLSLFLAVFTAVLLAVFLGAQLAAPLLLLADGVRQVAAGDLTPKAVLKSKDELGGLTRSFADMTQQLSDARAAVDSSMMQVSSARENLQIILDNLTSGVIVLDANGVIQSFNPSAARILRTTLANFAGKSLSQIAGLESFASGVQSQFDAYLSERKLHNLDHWQQSYVLNVHAANDTGLEQSTTAQSSPYATQHTINLIARGAELPGDDIQGDAHLVGDESDESKKSLRLLVFDDISEIVSSQRAQAWGDVARRLAHEIKNPLTPIQLSAQRLEKKLTGKLEESEQAIVTKSVKTIVDQVEAMKRLVNEFRDYARLPAAELKPVDLNALATDILQLYGAEDGLAAPAKHGATTIAPVLDPLCPRIMGDAQQLRQVIHNLLQNAVDATELATKKHVTLATQWNAETRRVRLVVTDSGTGFPEYILKRAFEPYVTSKSHGTGLGLAVVKKIAEEHSARIDISNRVTDGVIQGAQVSLSFAVDSALTVKAG